MKLMLGDCLDRMREIEDGSVDSIVTDPPYGLGFMGKAWDGLPPGREVFEQCLRVLKPGGYLLAFGGSRTYHRLAVAVEDAGFEIRDQIMWIYGSGFPKSHDVSKGIDKAAGAERAVVGTTKGKGGENLNTLSRTGMADSKDAKGCGAYGKGAKQITIDLPITAPATDAAKQWQGWGTALKPAHEPICVARKPLIGTVAQNVLAHGTGALNIDGCRVGTGEDRISGGNQGSMPQPMDWGTETGRERPTGARWPANIIHDGSDEVLAGFPSTAAATAGTRQTPKHGTSAYGNFAGTGKKVGYVDCGGSAARFFYRAKASKRDREDGNNHPTVKPTDLMRYLCRLVTPPGGTVLDPFTGSGSTGKAAMVEGFNFIGIERDPDYFAIAEKRIAEARNATPLLIAAE